MRNRISRNKYKLMAITACLYLVIDGLMHKGLVRVMLPVSFPRYHESGLRPRSGQNLEISSKGWIKAVNTKELLNDLPQGTAGFECDVYFNRLLNRFEVHHDKKAITGFTLDSLFVIYRQRKLNASVWLDFKNLRDSTHVPALAELIRLRALYKLDHKIMVESNHPELLQAFGDSGFFTAYYTPYFNPYKVSGDTLRKRVDWIASRLEKYPVNALTGYYYQYPFLHHYFPFYNLLIWSPDDRFSLVNLLFRSIIRSENAILIDLHP